MTLILIQKKPFDREKTANNTLPQKLENHCISSSSYWITLLATVPLPTLYLGTSSSSPTYEHMR